MTANGGSPEIPSASIAPIGDAAEPEEEERGGH